jgi:diguanylate cyclase (GGDEF)-like protein
MDSLGPRLRHVASALARGWRRAFRGARRASRFGIATRLSAAIAAVVVLTVAANQIAEHGSSLRRAIAERQIPAAEPHDDSQAPEVLPAALDRYQSAALSRAESREPARIQSYDEAAALLDAARATYVAVLGRALGADVVQGLDGGVFAHRELGEDLIRSTDARRRLVAELDIELAELDGRMETSLDEFWATSGSAAGREHLLEGNRLVDELGRRLTGLSALRGYGAQAIRAVAASERRFAALLERHEDGIVRALGAEWLARTRANFDRVVWLRGLLVRTDVRRRDLIEEFTQSHAVLAGQIRSTNTRFESERALEGARRQSAAALSAVSELERRQRALLGWLSAGVLLLLVAIMVSTVTSVVRPVRRLVDATRRLAQGETGVLVPRGGIKELDTLAVSFNQMAERLAAAQELAREYHGQLEAKVEERTRQLQHLAAHDPLTRLPNRRQYLRDLNATLARAAESGRFAGVYFLDLDNFKTVNDSMGHVFGDRVLQAVAERLRAAVEGFGYCARLGGDEFTVVYERAERTADIERAAEELVQDFQEPLVVDGRELLMGLSIGASVYPAHGHDPESLLRAADAALFHAKAQGRSQSRLFSPELFEAAAARFATEQGLGRAIERGEFELHFQPQVSLASGQADTVEALLRWRLPDGSYASPQDFLPVAEDCGLIREIGEWVIHTAIEHVARWRSSAWPDVSVAINVSSLELLDSRFADGLRHALLESGVPPSCIEVELTENVLQTGRHTTEALIDVRRLGVGVALDDFGTGYSSLVSLQQLPLTRVKLDRSLIASIDTSARSQAITRAIIALCQSLGLEITAEGVEREQQLSWLLGYPAMHVQGFLLCDPVAEADLLRVLTATPARMEALLRQALPENAVPIARFPSRRRSTR